MTGQQVDPRDEPGIEHPGEWLTTAQAVRRAEAVVQRSRLLGSVTAVLHARTGRPRLFSAHAYLVALALHAHLGWDMILKHAMNTLNEELQDQPGLRERVGLAQDGEPVTYRQFWWAWDRVQKALARGEIAVPHDHDEVDCATGEIMPCPPSCPYRVLDGESFMSTLLYGSAPASAAPTGAFALDATDFETWGRRRAHGEYAEPGWPRVGPNGRPQKTVDVDADEGYAAGKNAAPGGTFCGFHNHLAVDVRKPGGPKVPPLIRAAVLTSAGSHSGRAGVALVDQVRALGQCVEEVCADSAYSYAKPETYAYPLWLRGVEVISNLHPHQRGQHPGPKPGTVWIDGSLFVEALPKPLRKLPGFPIGMHGPEIAKLRARYEQRAEFAFSAHGARDAEGYQRLKGPALAKRVRCVNVPASMRLPHDRPTTNCRSGEPCACGTTVTVPPTAFPRERQRHPWGTSRWAADYHRRSLVETANSLLKTHYAKMTRGYTRVLGLHKNSILLAFALAAINTKMLHRWNRKHRQQDPWRAEVGEPPAVYPTAQEDTRAKRRGETLQDLAEPRPG